ncbi:cation diffusion facilitator family transporter [Halarchaeum rubridurum]|uniref:Transporter n=1 Tax=Halarchaeum rubridurum TaxID=489911 RepID=A0A830G415_9EURY|nr:cation diffusion facilitator family transporter [Halarchaeum rubridurum]MBP1955749.1 cation diffusion facilitator family transporter [Halarchaeum rubridurum]GGM74836.1 transporter [Halarchaeum rubridurum]
MASSKRVVVAAGIANGAIAVLKFLGFLLTGSPAMLSETYHSISDTGNQVFLLIGLRYSGREADRTHPFGYGKAQFFYSFLVSVLLFGIAGWMSLTHGYEAIVHGHGGGLHGTVEFLGASFRAVYVNYAVLIGAFGFEGYALVTAYRGMRVDMEAHGWTSFVEAFKKTSNITTLTAFTEDTVAVCGIVLAFVGVLLTDVTGNPLWDGLAALCIGLLLMGFALALAWENKRLLLGESLPKNEEDELRATVAGWEGVADVVDFRTVYFGPNRVLVATDVAFADDLDTGEVDERITAIEDALIEQDPGVRKVYIEPETATSAGGH